MHLHIAHRRCLEVSCIITPNPSGPFHAGDRERIMQMVTDNQMLFVLVDNLSDILLLLFPAVMRYP